MIIIKWLQSCTGKEERIGEIPKTVCDEVDMVLGRVYSHPECLSLEVQALYTMNVLAQELIVKARSPRLSHVEAIIATLMGWGQIKGNFKLKQNPERGVAVIRNILNIRVPGGMTLREYALRFSILDLKDDVLEKVTRNALSYLDGNPATWKYKKLHLLLPAIYPPFDANISKALFGSKTLSTNGYVKYLRCFKQLAAWYVKNCGGFEPVEGLGYARKLVLGTGAGRIELYLPLTRLLDFVVWSESTHKPGEKGTIYEYIIKICSV